MPGPVQSYELQEAGLEVVLISGRVSSATEVRAKELSLEFYQDGVPILRAGAGTE